MVPTISPALVTLDISLVRRGDAVLLARADYEALEETAHLIRVPANARRLIESLQQARTGQREEHDLTR